MRTFALLLCTSLLIACGTESGDDLASGSGAAAGGSGAAAGGSGAAAAGSGGQGQAGTSPTGGSGGAPSGGGSSNGGGAAQGGSSGGSPSGGAPATVCQPGKQDACACPGSSVTGAQSCKADGSGWGACEGCPGSQGGSGGAGGMGGEGGGGAAGTASDCPYSPDDHDGDGWSEEEGDCNDCDPTINPGALDKVNYMTASAEVPLPDDQQIDEDCDGVPVLPNAPTACDAALPIAVGDARDAARAMGLCQFAEEAPADPRKRRWGVIAASLSDISGNALSAPLKPSSKDMNLNFGLLPGFGVGTKPREGERIFALSSGEARAPDQEGFVSGSVCNFDKGYTSNFPPGFPKQGTCGLTGAPHDGVALDLKIRVPTNVKSMRFNFRFFTCEFPSYVCQVYNDVFAVLMAPSPLPPNHEQGSPGNALGNVVFDSMANVIGVNNPGFFTTCQPNPTPDPGLPPLSYEKALKNLAGYTNCKSTDDLAGSGFEGHGASGWLQSQVPVTPGSTIFLRFAIWDSQDGILDSTAIVDNFTWSTEVTETKTEIVQ